MEPKNLGKGIRNLRIESGIGLRQLSRMADISPASPEATPGQVGFVLGLYWVCLGLNWVRIGVLLTEIGFVLGSFGFVLGSFFLIDQVSICS